MILIKENVERIIDDDDDSQGIIDQLLLDGWSKVPVVTDSKPKRKGKKGKTENGVNADGKTV